MKSVRRIAVGMLVAALVMAMASELVSAHGPARSSRVPARSSGAAPPGPQLSAQPSLAVIRPAPEFTLVDPYGRTVSLSNYQGKVVLLAFIYTSCPSACPLITQRMAVLQRRLAEARLLPPRVSLVSVSVDPARDTGPVLARYSRDFGASSEGWWFLTETPDRLRPVLAAYDEWTRPQTNGEIDHPARLFLIDALGRIREIYSLALFDERQAFYDIQALVRESRPPAR